MAENTILLSFERTTRHQSKIIAEHAPVVVKSSKSEGSIIKTETITLTTAERHALALLAANPNATLREPGCVVGFEAGGHYAGKPEIESLQAKQFVVIFRIDNRTLVRITDLGKAEAARQGWYVPAPLAPPSRMMVIVSRVLAVLCLGIAAYMATFLKNALP